VPFTLVHAEKYETKDEPRTDITKTKDTQKKQTTWNTAKQNYPGRLVQSPLTTLGQETRWAYSTTLPSPHRAQNIR